ncbi:unnamed protein product [Victoria cruziana]
MALISSIFGRGREPFSMDIWDPFGPIFCSSVASPSLRSFASDASAVANTQIDWKETPEAHVFMADLPGLKKEEVKVELEEGKVLKISGERRRESEEKNEKWHRVESCSGKFLRRFRLPENVIVDQTKAAMEDGVLTVTVPKSPEPKPDVKSIEITG